MRVVIDGFDLPGRTFCDPDGHPLNDVRVGVQVGQEPHDLVPGDAMAARWELDVGVVAGSDASVDFRGPAVHGKRGDRFLYLTWGHVDDHDRFHMFRRAKLMLNRIDRELVTAAEQQQRPLVLRVHGLRRHRSTVEGVTVMKLLVPTKESEMTTVTLAEIISHRRTRVGSCHQTSIAEACRTFSISRTTYYRWADRAARYGLAALMPKQRRTPAMPNQTAPHVIEIVLAEAVARPTLGARRLLEHLAERDVLLSASGVQKILRRHNLGHRRQRVAALAQITAADTGLVTRDAKDGPFGFCYFAARPGDLVALDSFYVGKLKGVGTVWQLTAIDTTTRWAICQLFVGDKTAQRAADFVDHIKARLHAIRCRAVRCAHRHS